MYNPFSLSGKTILVTGASSGIGRSVAVECSKMGAMLVISGRNNARLNKTFKMLEGSGHKQIVADFSSNTFISGLLEEVSAIDGIVHCAGFTKTLPFPFLNEEDMSSLMQVNFMAPVLLSQAFVKNKKLNKGSSIVFISSISGVLISLLGNSMYSASKGAVNGIVKGMALDLAVKNIRVNTVCPGMIETEILESGVITREQLLEDVKKYPLKRYGKPEEVAHAVIYLLSDASSWVTGSNLLIDGGYTLA
jgi:NAD(P)-dependent dehydrogenase (short-subunit alcohol dehydrogenase family)